MLSRNPLTFFWIVTSHLSSKISNHAHCALEYRNELFFESDDLWEISFIELFLASCVPRWSTSLSEGPKWLRHWDIMKGMSILMGGGSNITSRGRTADFPRHRTICNVAIWRTMPTTSIITLMQQVAAEVIRIKATTSYTSANRQRVGPSCRMSPLPWCKANSNNTKSTSSLSPRATRSITNSSIRWTHSSSAHVPNPPLCPGKTTHNLNKKPRITTATKVAQRVAKSSPHFRNCCTVSGPWSPPGQLKSWKMTPTWIGPWVGPVSASKKPPCNPQPSLSNLLKCTMPHHLQTSQFQVKQYQVWSPWFLTIGIALTTLWTISGLFFGHFEKNSRLKKLKL